MCLENVMASFQEVLNGHVCEVRTLLPREVQEHVHWENVSPVLKFQQFWYAFKD